MVFHLQTAALTEEAPIVKGNTLIRNARLVYIGGFESLDGHVDVTEGQLHNIVQMTNKKLAAATPEGAEYPDFGACPPLQLDHSRSARDTVGRVIGPLRMGTYEGKPAIYSPIMFIGEENVAPATDGRWTHLSVGVDFESGLFEELAITPFPAAPNASLLSRPEWSKILSAAEIALVERLGKTELPGHVDEALWEKAKLAAEDAKASDKWAFTTWWYKKNGGSFNHQMSGAAKMEKMISHLMATLKLSQEAAAKHLAEMKPEDKEKMSKEMDETDKKKLAAEEEEKKKLAAEEDEKKKMAAAEEEKKEEEKKKLRATAKAGVMRLGKEMRSAFGTVRTELRAGTIASRLSTLRAKAQITPAEIKKINIVDLSKMADDALDAFFKGFDGREPVIPVGQYGTAKGSRVASLASDFVNRTRMGQRLSNMPFTKMAVGKQLGYGEGGCESRQQGAERLAEEQRAQGADHLAELEHCFSLACKQFDEGKRDEAFKSMRAYMESRTQGAESMSGEMHPDSEKRMATLAESHKRLQNQFEELVKLVAPVLEIESAELAG